MPKAKKIPMRTCIACRGEKPKKEVLRVVRNSEGKISLDFSGKLPGRGAYICDSADCIKRLRKYRLLNKTFSCEVPEEVYTRIEEEFSGGR